MGAVKALLMDAEEFPAACPECDGERVIDVVDGEATRPWHWEPTITEAICPTCLGEGVVCGDAWWGRPEGGTPGFPPALPVEAFMEEAA